jgi:16S rRNA (adenine1518-N6/adenine1519-N6)-dimethyltransferase
MSDLPKKHLGQHWLIDVYYLNLIAEAAEIGPEDTVLEIGPGSGNLTRVLIPQAKEVIAVEIDEELVERLIKLNHPKLKILNQDILKFNLNQMPPGYKIVANIPYYLTSKLIRQIGDASNKPKLAVLLVQKEIAERLSALPGNLSILGVTCQYFWDVEKLDIISADKFYPPPKVDSQVVRLTPIESLPLNLEEEKKLFQLVKIGFSSKRKTLSNNIASGYKLDKDQVNNLLVSSGLETMIRPQELSLDQWIDLLQKLNGLFN